MTEDKDRSAINSILLFIILIVATTLRFWNYSEIPFMHDELSALARTQYPNLRSLIDNGVALYDTHPAGVQVFIYYWIKLFGNSEMSVKLPFILFGLLSIIIAYKISKKWFNSSVGLVVASFMAVMQYMVMYSQIARPYISGVFFSLLMVWCWSNYFFEADRNKKRWLAGFILSSALCAYNHHFSLLFAGIVWLTGLFFLSKNNWKGYVLAGIIIIILYLPHLNIFFFQLSKGGLGGSEGWLSRPDSGWLFTYFQYVLHYSWLMYLLFILLICSSIYFYSKELKAKQKFRAIAICWFLSVFLIEYFYSVILNPVLQFSTIIFVFPFLLMFVFSLSRELGTGFKTMTVGSILTIGIFTLVFQRKHYLVFYHQPYQDCVLNTYKMLNSIGNEKSVTIEHAIPPYFKEYYFKKYGRAFNYIYYNPFESKPDPKGFRSFVYQQKTDYFILGNLPLEYMQIIKEKYPYLVKNDQHLSHSFYCFSRTEKKQGQKEKTIFHERYNFSTKNAHWTNVQSTAEETGRKEVWRLSLDSTQEYGATFSVKLKEIVKSRHTIIDISADFYSKDPGSNPVLVLDIHDGDESLLWAGADYFLFNNNSEGFNRVYLSRLLAGLDLKAHPNATIKIFVWNRNKKPLLVSDFKIETRADNPIVYGLYEGIEK